MIPNLRGVRFFSQAMGAEFAAGRVSTVPDGLAAETRLKNPVIFLDFPHSSTSGEFAARSASMW